MAFDFKQFFSSLGKTSEELGEKTLVVKKNRCPQNHRCPAISACPSGALSQRGNAAPVVNYKKCTSCGKCTRYCITRALKMERA
ncbi:MAG: 4Fe-4S binding protein [Sphaerochaeta sp.]|nr:4Fe-4S binding protein [Sphaerochaeta sp.]